MADRSARARGAPGKSAAWLRGGLVFAVVVCLDQLTKHLLERGIAPGQQRALLPGLELVHAQNDGVAFSVSAGSPRIVVALIVVAIVAIVAYFVSHAERRLLWLPAGMMVGGAVGNLIDRVRAGSVTDFIKLPHWPAFNLADTAITLGVIALLFVLRDDAPSRPA